MNPLRAAFERLEEIRAGSIARKVRRFIAPGWSVLDLGGGNLVVADAVARATGARLFALDAIAFRRRPIPLALYGGGRAPFRDGAFDAVLVAFVFHHCADGGEAVLREAARLARSRVIVLEDAYDTAFERWSIRLLDPILNRLEDSRIPTPLRFRPTAAWIELFGRLGLRTAAAKRIRTTPVLRTAQVMFILEKAAGVHVRNCAPGRSGEAEARREPGADFDSRFRA